MIPVGGKNECEVKPRSDPDAGTLDPLDGRVKYQWATCYPRQARVEIYCESSYLFLIFVVSFLLILAAWKGWASSFIPLSLTEANTLKKYTYYAASGMLGGAVFDIKYLYRAVARGYWHQDRRIWRLMSPLIALAVAFVIGAMINASLIATGGQSSGAAIISTGFLAGYFADKAVAKMYEIANVIFGKSASLKEGNGKQDH